MYCVACVLPKVPLKKDGREEAKRIQKLKKIWKVQKQIKKEEKKLVKDFWQGSIYDAPLDYDLDFEDLFDSF
jgi:hypothetical protein